MSNLIDFANTHRNGSSIKKAVSEGISFDSDTNKAVVLGKSISLTQLQIGALVMSALQHTFSTRDNNAAFSTFKDGSIDRLTDDKGNKTTIAAIPETIDQLSIEQVLTVVNGDLIEKVDLTVEDQIGLGIYNYTEEDKAGLQALVNAMQAAVKWLTMINDLFGFTDISLAEATDTKMVFSGSQSMVRWARSYGNVKDSKDSGWYINPSSATPSESLTDMLFTLELDLTVFEAKQAAFQAEQAAAAGTTA